jgi:hypothetical protein
MGSTPSKKRDFGVSKMRNAPPKRKRVQLPMKKRGFGVLKTRNTLSKRNGA